MHSPGNQQFKVSAVKSHPLYKPIKKLTILRSQLLLALLILKDSIDGYLPDMDSILPSGHAKTLSNVIVELIQDIFNIYRMRLSAQREVCELIEEFQRLSPGRKLRDSLAITNKKTKHDPAVIEILKRWLFSHIENPYPTQQEKESLYEATNLTPNQLNDWFVNARRRILKKAHPEPLA
ncbi:Homeobox protein pknox2 [Massospora cicadina]|nr:Homeobox protein pknox2 [Massospora cicadina]